MSVKIYHGPHGSYKTASAILDLIPVAKQGRVIVTNARGVTAQRFHDLYDDLPTSFDVININRETSEGIQKIKTFWHWVPDGAFMLWDEGQRCFPKSMRQPEIDSLRYKTPEEAHAEGRAHEWDDAWDMERHNNYDMIITTPHIDKIRSDIRENAEMAVKHKNQAILGAFFKGKYLQSWHSPDTSGMNTTHFYQSVARKMTDESECWKLYDSTKTGEVKDTAAGFNLFKSPKLVFAIVLILLASIYLFRKGKPEVIHGVDKPTANKTIEAADNVTQASTNAEVLSVPFQAVSANNSHVFPYVPSLKRSTPVDIVNKVRTEPILTGCVSSNDQCICYTHNGVKLDVNMTYCGLIQKSGFYYVRTKQPEVVEEPETIKDKITNSIKSFTSNQPVSPTSLDELYQQDDLKLQNYEEIMQTRQIDEPVKGSTISLPSS